MNWRHLYAFLWLRWRIRFNQMKKHGALNAIITAIAAISMIPGALILFITAFGVAAFAIPLIPDEYRPMAIMFAWDGLIVGFLFSWTIALVAELQRSEALSLDKFLHLPVSLWGVFLINYLSSLASFNLLVFVPLMLGLALGLIVGESVWMLLLLPLLAAFLLAITALTYQFQGWLAALMVNKRRRRTIVVFATLAIILVSQLPNLINFYRPWQANPAERLETHTEELKKLQKQLVDKEITGEEHQKRVKEINDEWTEKTLGSEKAFVKNAENIAWVLNIALPPGWLALGARTLADGIVWPALLGTIGLALIGSASLWRAYRTTLRIYTGQTSSAEHRPMPALPQTTEPAAPAPRPVLRGLGYVEKQLPWVPEQAAAIALTGLRSLLRAPEAKMLLVTPFIMIVVFGGAFFTQRAEIPLYVRPLIAFGGIAMALLTMVQLVGNQFGFDRAGFRLFVLCPVPRREILLGKNLSVAPLAFVVAGIMVAIVEVVYTMRIDHLVMVLMQIGCTFLLFCAIFNWLSIIAPTPVAQGSLKMAKPKFTTVMLQMMFGMLLPLGTLPAAAVIGLEWLLDYLDVVHNLPIALTLTLLEAVSVVFIYRQMLTWQGKALQALEQKILDTVTRTAE